MCLSSRPFINKQEKLTVTGHVRLPCFKRKSISKGQKTDCFAVYCLLTLFAH